ncbi:sulfite exporter TauE/SafE family protein [Thermococcus waiotapuensis]|uniref:Probable membrane transporter protein n=1 Tax=Thermococcus waiotapuensis TaxID=90909 RepID=A0AAE4NUD1_9EURY|nr:sulfite exporter TauE/SafE family protein [Thermococcus waiotapuensis]MDV3103511.1 sulfite exporter TauE/SafE family protein [Thermococcus waiotapuensis]
MIGIAILTYILASLFAIAGMGAAGVLIPNYITLGLSVHAAMFLGLGQNTAELTVATAMNSRRGLVEWRKVAMILLPAIFFVPVGAYINLKIPRVLVLVAFDLFLLFALYRMLFPRNIKGERAEVTTAALGALEGFIAGLIGMDAAPIALIAFAYLFDNPKKISANTAATALGVSTTALLTYYIMLPSVPIETGTLIGVVTAGFLGGITGVFLMHRVKPNYVRYTILAILGLAFIEVLTKIVASAGQVSEGLYALSVGTVALGALAFLLALVVKFLRGGTKASAL